MLFIILLGCSDDNISFDSQRRKKSSNSNEEELLEDTMPPIDSGETFEGEDRSSDVNNEEEFEDTNHDGTIDVDDVMDIFQNYSCQGCHGSSGGFRLNESELKNGTSTATGEPYIVSGMPQQSYLYLKITDAGGISGQPMPIGGVGLMQDEDIEIVRQWITDGTLGL